MYDNQPASSLLQGTRQQVYQLFSIIYNITTSVMKKNQGVQLLKRSITDLMCKIIKRHHVVNLNLA